MVVKKESSIRRIRVLLVALVAFFPQLNLAQTGKAEDKEIKVAIEANAWNKPRLLKKLNQHGAKYNLKFLLVDSGFDYRIGLRTGQTKEQLLIDGTGGTLDYPTAFATVYDSNGQELFEVQNEATWSEEGAINGLAKKILGRLRSTDATVNKENDPQSNVPPQKNATPSEQAGTVTVTSTPEGADVYADGDFVGNAPATLKLSPGKHTIRIVIQGYIGWEREIAVQAGSQLNVKATLEKQN